MKKWTKLQIEEQTKNEYKSLLLLLLYIKSFHLINENNNNNKNKPTNKLTRIIFI